MSALRAGQSPEDRVLWQSIQPGGIIVPTKDFRAYMLYLNGWFMWNGEMYDMSGKGVGAGLTRISATPRYKQKGTEQ